MLTMPAKGMLCESRRHIRSPSQQVPSNLHAQVDGAGATNLSETAGIPASEACTSSKTGEDKLATRVCPIALFLCSGAVGRLYVAA